MTGTKEEFFAEGGGGGNFAPHPEGQHQAVVCDIRSLGMKEVFFKGESKGEKPHLLLTFQSTEIIQTEDESNKFNGKPFVVSRQYTVSNAENSRLRKDTEAILGRKLTTDEAKDRGFNFANLLGLNCQVTIEHSPPKDGRVYANIVAVAPWNKKWGELIDIDPEYIRWKDRPEKAGAADEADLKASVSRLQSLVRTAGTYGIEPEGKIEYDKMSAGEVNDAIKVWTKAVDDAKAAKKAAEAEEEPDVFDGDEDEGDEDDKTVASATDPDSEDFEFDEAYEANQGKAGAPGKPAGNAPKAAAGKKAAPGNSPTPGAQKKAGNITEAVRNKAAKARAEEEETETPFDEEDGEQKASDRINAAWVEAGNNPLSDAMLLFIDGAEDAQLDVPDDFMENEDILEAVNKSLKKLGKKPLDSLSGLKSAGCALLNKEVTEERLLWEV